MTKSSKSPHLKLGRRGERCAARALRRRGYVVIERNYRTRLGEIDIIARHGETLVFVEVKTRRSTSIVPAEANVDARKKRHIHRVAQQYLSEKKLPYDTDCRIDVVSVTMPARWWPRPNVEVFQDAFEVPSWG
jgi:putative endonuclease